MRRIVIILAILAACLIGKAPVSAAGASSDLSWEERLDRTGEYVMEQLERIDVLGGVYGIIHRDSLVHTAGFGTVRIGEQAVPNEQTVFSIASVTKSFTATAIYQLEDRGLLDIDQPVGAYIPGFSFQQEDQERPVTLRHLLTHSAGGIGSYQTDGILFQDREARDSVDRYGKLLEQVSVKEVPGTTGNYCNGCFDILGQVIEQVSGISYYDYMEQYILQPISMNSTLYGDQLHRLSADRIADEYHWFFTRRAQLHRNMEAFGRAQDPDGGMYSTLDDLAKYVSYQLGYGERMLLQPDSIADSRLEYVLTESEDAYYTASGFETAQLHGTQVYWKVGDGIGSGSIILFIPEHELGLVLLFGEFRPGIQLPIAEGAVSVLLGYEPDNAGSMPAFGLIVGLIAIAFVVTSLVLFGLLGRRIVRRSLYAGSIQRAVLSLLVWVVVAAPLWYVLLLIRPSGMGFYGYPYDAAIGLVLFTAAATLWSIYYLLVLVRKRYTHVANV